FNSLHAGQHHHGNEARVPVGLELAAELRPAELGQHEVDDDEIDFFAGQNLESARRTIAHQNAAVRCFQHGADHPPIDLGVVHDQDDWWRFSLSVVAAEGFGHGANSRSIHAHYTGPFRFNSHIDHAAALV